MFLLRRPLTNARQIAPSIRCMASQGPLVDLTVDNDGVAIMTLQRPPVNSLNLELLTEMSKSLDEVAKNKSKGMILTSDFHKTRTWAASIQQLLATHLTSSVLLEGGLPTLRSIAGSPPAPYDPNRFFYVSRLLPIRWDYVSSPTVFSAGLDIMEMYKPDMNRAEQFWTTLQDVWFKLYGSGFATAAAINGHAPAGGCLLSMSCEYRVMMGGKYTIGLNETALGIVAPKWFMDTMCHTISTREAEYALTTARMFTTDEALKVGLIDEIGSDKSDIIAKCKAFLNKFYKIPPLARAITKQKIREGAIKNLQTNRQADTQEFLGYLKNPKVQNGLEMYLEGLKKKAAAKK